MSEFQENVKDLIKLVKEITESKLPPFKKSKFERKMEAITNTIVSHGVLTFVLMVFLAALTYFFKDTSLKYTTLTVGAITALLGWAIQIAVIISTFPFLWEMRKDPYGPFFQLMTRAALHDSHFLDRLKKYDPTVLRFVVSHYKTERSSLEKRGSLLSGSLEKIGFFPAVAALFVLSTNLVKAPLMENWGHPFIFLIFAFYVFSFMTFAMQQKMDAVISLMEFSLDSVEEELVT